MKLGVNTLFLVPGDVGGTEVYLRQNLQEMTGAFPETGFVLFTTMDNDTQFRDDLQTRTNVEYIQLPFKAANRPVRILAEQFLLPGYVRRSGVSVLWSPGYTAPLRCSCPQAVTIHDLQYKSHPEDLSFLERITLDFLVSSACRVCEAVLVVSEFSRQEILSYGFTGEEKMFTVLEGVDPVFASPPEDGEANPVRRHTAEPYILCVAHTYPHKNVHILVQAFGQIADRVPHHLVLVGKPRRGEDLVRQSLESLQCRNRVHRFSGLDCTQLRRVYQDADLFVLPSEYEGFGLPVLEAMLAGVPVITTDKASLPEVGGAHGIYIQENTPPNIGTAMMDVITMNEADRNSLIEGGRAWASSFTWPRSAAGIVQVLEKIC